MGIIRRIQSKVRPQPIDLVRTDYKLWDGLRTGWGRGVAWHSGFSNEGVAATGRISGFDPHMDPRVGDVFYTDMQSGRRMLWVVTGSENCGDPRDMYFASLARIGYEDENPLPVSTYVEPKFQFFR